MGCRPFLQDIPQNLDNNVLRHRAVQKTQWLKRELYAPAFFSCKVISFQSTFIRSLSDIHRSACS